MTLSEAIPILRRRMDALASRIAQNRPNPKWRGLSYDQAELHALKCVLDEVEPGLHARREEQPR